MASGFLTEFYIASYGEDGAAVRFGLSADGHMTQLGRIPLPNPMWIEWFPDRAALGAILRDDKRGDRYVVVREGEDAPLEGPVLTRGVEVCHFARQGRDVYCANYESGSVAWIRDGQTTLRQHRVPEDGACGPNRDRQRGPHCHQCLLSPCGRFVLVCDLGLDTVFVYDRELGPVSRAKVPDGYGPRHAVFSRDGQRLYVLSEMASAVTEFDWDGERGVLSSPRSIRFTGITGRLTDAASIVLSKDGEHLYCSNRGDAHTLAHLTTAGGLRLVSEIPSGGEHPRAIQPVGGGEYLVVCNTFSDRVTLFRVGPDGELRRAGDTPIPKPLCVTEIQERQ